MGRCIQQSDPGQTVIKIVTEELVKAHGFRNHGDCLKPGNEITIIMMAGLQGAGKTTTTAKIAGKMKAKGKSLFLQPAMYIVLRPLNSCRSTEKVGVPVFTMGTGINRWTLPKAAVEHAAKNGMNLVILDTAGRLHIDEGMMEELVEIKDHVDVCQTILVVDAMTGQDAVNISAHLMKNWY